MKRHACQPRPEWRAKVASIGLTYHSHEQGPYWDESACYELTADEVDALEKAANALHFLCIDAAEAVIKNRWWARLGIPEKAVSTILASWERDDFSLYGRFDLSYDTVSAPKLLEYNADTPTALVEAAIAQWFWLQDLHPGADQFNSIHERLIAAWQRWAGQTIYFTSVGQHAEDEMTLLYLRDTCEQAGARTRSLSIEEVGWDARQHRFVDLALNPIVNGFKLYPWEWLWADPFGEHLGPDHVRLIEPAWKMLVNSKGLLPILWELFPGHPNLLPAFDSPGPLGQDYVRKPRLSREGSNVRWVEHGRILEENEGRYGAEGYVYQAIGRGPEFGHQRPVFGVWVVDHEAAGLGIREDTRRITGNLSRFVPHYFCAP
jgi:glutathionylspermidine synthase